MNICHGDCDEEKEDIMDDKVLFLGQLYEALVNVEHHSEFRILDLRFVEIGMKI